MNLKCSDKMMSFCFFLCGVFGSQGRASPFPYILVPPLVLCCFLSRRPDFTVFLLQSNTGAVHVFHKHQNAQDYFPELIAGHRFSVPF